MNWLARLKIQKAPRDHPTETTKRVSVVSVGTPTAHIQKIEADAAPANDRAPDPDRWSWPHSTAMNTVEIDTFTVRLARFTDRGLILSDAECLADRLVIRDREKDDRAVCLECTHLQGTRCNNWQAAGVAIRTREAFIPVELMVQLQRCDGFRGGIAQSYAGEA